MGMLPKIRNESGLERFGEQFGKRVSQMKRCFLEEKWGNVIRSTGSFMAELLESLIDNVRVEINMAAAN
jgi:hypothetical protein